MIIVSVSKYSYPITMDGSKSVLLICVTWSTFVFAQCQQYVQPYAGKLEIVQPAIVGREVELRFSPHEHRDHAKLSLQYFMINKAWIDLNDYKCTIDRGGAYELILFARDGRRLNGKQLRVRYGQYFTRPIILRLEDLTGTCGYVYLRSQSPILTGDTVELCYLPAPGVIDRPDIYVREWYKSMSSSVLHVDTDTNLREREEPNDEFVLEINNFDQGMNGCYDVKCRDGIYTNSVQLVVTVPPTKPAIGPITSLQDGGVYIIVKRGNDISVHCVTAGTNLTVVVWVNGRTCRTEESGTGIFSATECKASDVDHLTTVRCSVLNAAVKEALFSKEYRLYVVEKASAIEINHIQDLREGSPVNITCKVTGGRPPPKIAFTVDNITIDQGLMHLHDDRTYRAKLHFVKREWNGKNIGCQYNNSYFTGRSPERLLNIYYDAYAQTDATDQNKSSEEAVYRSALIVMIFVACAAVVVVLVILYRQHKRLRQIVAREDCPPENAHEDIVVEYASVKKNRSKPVDYKTENELVHVELDKHALEASTGRKTTKVGDVDQHTEHDYQKRQEEDEEVVEYVNQCGRHI